MDTMNALIHYLPTKWVAPITVGFAVLTIGGRIYHALKNGGGLIGIWNAVVLGKSTNKTEDNKQD